MMNFKECKLFNEKIIITHVAFLRRVAPPFSKWADKDFFALTLKLVKALIVFFVFVICSFLPPSGTGQLCAQTTLPTSWSFSGNMPNGWTASGMAYYSASGNTPPAGKFDGTGDWMQIHFTDAPGALTYYLAGNTFSGGTFTVEESVNGNTWTTLHVHTAPSSTYTQYTDAPNSVTRYIRFFYTQKVTGNIGVDDVNIAIAPAGPAQEINVKFNSANVPSGGTVYFSSPVSTTTPISFTVENLGTTNTLSIVSSTVTGAQASDFTVTSSPSSVPASGTATLTIDFLPPVTGTRLATLTIINDDANENPYVINFYGIGGNYSSEPTAQPTALTFSSVKSYRFNVSYTAASPAPDGGYLILRKTGSAITDLPADGTVYTKGEYIGTSQVAYVGTATSVVPNYIVANKAYYFSLFAFNGSGQYTNYMQATPLSGNVTSAGNMMGNNYSSINTSLPAFITDLHNIVNPHTSIFYGNYAITMIDLFASRDTSNGQKVVTCAYTGYQHVYTIPFDWSILSREHTFCHSWMPTNPADNPEKPEYNDQHHLFPVEFANANQVRSNYPLGKVVTLTSQYLLGKFGMDASGNTVYEPRDEDKGDAARAMFYMCIAYTGVSSNTWNLPPQQDQDILKYWHWQDPPDSWEIARNDFLDSLQGNRNPFVDSVNYVCYIDFSTMTKINSPTVPCIPNISVNELQGNAPEIDISPNPSNGIFTLTILDKNTNSGCLVTIVDMLGKKIYEKSFSGNRQEIIIDNPSEGFYLLDISTKKWSANKKIVVGMKE